MIGVENRSRVRNVEHFVSALGPGNGDDPVDEIARDRELGRHRRHPAQLAQFPKSSLFNYGWKCLLHHLGLELGEVIAVLFTQLPMNYPQLLLQVELALVLEHRAANIVVDLPLQPQQVDLARKELAQHLDQMSESVGFEERLAELEPDGNVGSDAECLALSGVRALDDRDDFRRNPPVEAHVFFERVHHPPAERLGLSGIFGGRSLERERRRHSAQHGSRGYVARHSGAGDAFNQYACRAGWKSRDLHDTPDHAGAMEVGGGGFLLLAVALCYQQDDLVFRESRLDCGQGTRAPDQQRDDYRAENDNIPK